jgi:hypothetical protein
MIGMDYNRATMTEGERDQRERQWARKTVREREGGIEK